MLKRVIALLLLLTINLYLFPVEAMAAPPDCNGIVTLTPLLDKDNAGKYSASNNEDVIVHAKILDQTKFVDSGNPNNVPSFTLLISSAQGDGTPIKDSFLASLPVIGGLISKLSSAPSGAVLAPLLIAIPGAAVIAGAKALWDHFTTGQNDVTMNFGDITLPLGNDDSESSATKFVGGEADFYVPTLTRTGDHYMKVKQVGAGSTICVDNNDVINIKDASDISLYRCGIPGSYVGACVKGGGVLCDDNRSISTAIGCIPTDPGDFINGTLEFIARAAGGIALLLMAFGAVGMITSQGNAEALKSAQGRFVSAIIGLLVIILAVTLLQIIGVDILQIPGFGR